MNVSTTSSIIFTFKQTKCFANKPKPLFPIKYLKLEEQPDVGTILFYLIGLIYILILADHVCNAYFMPSIEYFSFEKLKLSPKVAGSTILAGASSSTELFISLMGVFFARNDIALNSIIGAASYNLLVITSICCFCVYNIPTRLKALRILRDFLFYAANLSLILLFLYKNNMTGLYWYESLTSVAIYGLFILVNTLDSDIKNFFKNFCQKRFSARKRKKNLKVSFYDDISVLDVEAVPKANEMYRVINRNKVIDINIDHLSNDYNEPYDVFQPYKQLKPLNFSTKFKLLFVFPARLFAHFTIVDFRRFEDHRDRFLLVTIVTSLFQIGLCSYFLLFILVKLCVTFSLPENIVGFSFLSVASSLDETLAAISMCKREVKRILSKKDSAERLNSALSNCIANNIFGVTVGIGLPYFLKSVFSDSPIRFFTPVYSKNIGVMLAALLCMFTLYLFILILLNWKFSKIFGLISLLLWLMYSIFIALIELNLIEYDFLNFLIRKC